MAEKYTTGPDAANEIPLEDMNKAIQGIVDQQEADQQFASILIIHPDVDAVETFFQYQITTTIDCKQLIGEIFLQKTKSQGEGGEFVAEKFMRAFLGHTDGLILPTGKMFTSIITFSKRKICAVRFLKF